MMLVKFTMVAAYFMHLKFDSKIFRRLFIVGILLALAVYGVALWTFTFAHRLPGAS
jgi:cytochrome c oxidase subunit IV